MLVKELVKIVDGELIGDGNLSITGIADFENAQFGEISFLEKIENLRSTNASCVIAAQELELSCPIIKVKNPKLAFAKIAAVLHPSIKRSAGFHRSTVLSDGVVLGRDVSVGAFCYIGENSEVGEGTEIREGAKIGNNVLIGANCIIHPNVCIYDKSNIGNNVILHSGVVIGADGFGYVRDGASGYVKFPQIGTVIIEDNVEIGANTCIDRGALGETRIGEGTKIDNLVQIAHNVQIGKRVVIASQTGISGSTIIEDDCVIGGQVGMGDHAKVLSGAIIGSQAGVLPGKIVRPGVWWGTPVQPLDDYKRQNALVKGLGRLKEEVKELKKRLLDSSGN